LELSEKKIKNQQEKKCQNTTYFTLGGQPDYLFYLQKLPSPLPPRNQLVVPKTKQEINEQSYEMVGVKITVTNYGMPTLASTKISSHKNFT
jgi:hypothetical protein